MNRFSCKSYGIDLDPWMEEVMEYFQDSPSLFPIEKKQLERLYHKNFTVEEVILKDLVKGQLGVHLELHIRHSKGKFETRFNNDEQAMEFFQKFPEVRHELLKI